MRSIVSAALVCVISFPLLAAPRKQKIEGAEFVYDAADKSMKAKVLDNELFYDPSILTSSEGAWMTWLEFQPGKGDVIWTGLRKGEEWVHQQQITEQPGAFAKPTLTRDAKGKLWLSYESGNDGKWDVFVRGFDGKQFGDEIKVSTDNGSDINHSTVAHPKDGLWIVWQSDQKGQFEILARQFSGKTFSKTHTVSSSPRGDWQPSAAITPKGDLLVAWDSYDGTSYDVLLRAFRNWKWTDTSVIAGTPAFEGRAQVVTDKNGRVFIAYEEDGENWGKHFVARTAGLRESTKLRDSVGPLHRFRKLHFIEVDAKTLQPRHRIALPQPSLKLAKDRPNTPEDLNFHGAFYERAQLVIDGQNRPWVVYRHYYTPWLGLEPFHHVEDDFLIYARCWLGDGWSELCLFDTGQGDGMQRLSLSPTSTGFVAAWTTGRTDRNKHPKRARGVAFAEVNLSEKARPAISGSPISIEKTRPASTQTTRRPRPVTEVSGQKFELFFGDLHRHTDLSLCYTPSDGTTEDAYRYAIDAAPLDFLGITDHTHDLQMGDPLSQLWWRSLKETDRHKLQNSFVTFYSYERSRGDTDHNVITLRPDRMRPHTYPLPDFWQELDSDTFTIPHEPFNRVLWNHKDNAHRPLLEIYQGFRDISGEDAANEGLLNGHQFGFIASSDHLSTSASFAGVWAEQPTRESIFRAMQARRTFGATAPIMLKVTSGKYWMGERFETSKTPSFKIEVQPTAGVETIELFTNSKLEKSVIDLISTPGKPLIYNWQPKAATGPNFYYVRITQTDGNRAWSSPIWVDIK